MIISDRYQFVFIHIPKCAGSYVRKKLSPYDDETGYFNGQVNKAPFEGVWHYAHIPLHVLREGFPSVYERIVRYKSFAVMRDPLDRFPSAVSQMLKEFKAMPLHTISSDELHKEVDKVIEYLSKNKIIADPSYIHFTRQIDYLELNGERPVDYIYTINNVHELLHDISALVGDDLVTQGKDHAVNQTDVYRHEILRYIFEGLRPKIQGTLLDSIPEFLKRGIRSTLYTPRKNNNHGLFYSQTVKDFVLEYYKEDFEVYSMVNNKRNGIIHGLPK